MFYSHQLLARKAPLGQIWMAATMHAKINRKKLSKLNIIKICEEILNPAVPMALRLSGILMGGVVIVYERKVKMLYAWKVKSGPDPTMLPKGKSQAKKSAITLPDKEQMTIEMEQSHQSNATWFQHNGYFSMTLDDVEEPNFGNRDQGNDHHQAAPEDINLPEPYQYNMDPPNRDERFDVGDDETQPNVTPADYGQFPPVFIPSPPPRDDPKRVEDRHPIPEHPRMRPHDDNMNAREESERRRPAKRKRVKPIQMDREQIVIAAPTYQSWLQDPSALVSKRGGMIKRRHDIKSSTKIANLMEVPSVTISPKHSPEPPSTPPGGSEDFDGRPHNPINGSVEMPVTHIPDNGLRVPNGTPHSPSGKSDGFQGGDDAVSIPETISGHGHSSHSDLERGRPTKRTRRSSSGNSSGGLHTVAENENFPDANFRPRLSNIGPTPDQDLFVETAPTQTQGKANHPSDELTKSIHDQMKKHFDCPGAPQYESLDALTTDMTRKKAALLFYQTCGIISQSSNFFFRLITNNRFHYQ
ncbi:Rad21/Rec8 family protein [Trifolium repens]|nr:Rad21/Rec8 family protein [Trifolium repens]